MDKMKLSEVAAFLGKSINQVRRYMDSGRLPATKNGKELFFDRDVVIKFAESRGIRIVESGLPQGTNFTNMQQAAEYLQRMIIPGMTITIVKPQEQPTA